MQRLGIGNHNHLSNSPISRKFPGMQDRMRPTPHAHGCEGMPVCDSRNRSGSLSSLSSDSHDIMVSFERDIYMSSLRGMKEAKSLSQSQPSSFSSLRDIRQVEGIKFLSIPSLDAYTGANMLVIESIIVLATACMIYILSTRRKPNTGHHEQGKHTKSTSSSTKSILANPLSQISRFFTCTSLSSQQAPTKPSPPKADPGPQKPAYVMPPLKPTSPHPTSMGLKRLDRSNWLTIDETYLPEHALRASLLSTTKPCVLQVLPPAIAATYELLDLVIEFLLQRYPNNFALLEGEDKILNKLTNEIHTIGSSCRHPLETAAKLCMEDFNILLCDPESEDPEEWKLMASATLFPAGWKLQERIGCSMAVLHAPVPGWKEKLGKSVNRYFTHLTPRSCMERSNLFIQTTDVLFQDNPEAPRTPDNPLTPFDIYVRRERQTFTRLEKSGAVLFTVRTYMEKLIDVKVEDAENLARQLRGWEREMARYKGIDNWGPVTLGWCDELVDGERRRRRDSGIDMGGEEEGGMHGGK